MGHSQKDATGFLCFCEMATSALRVMLGISFFSTSLDNIVLMVVFGDRQSKFVKGSFRIYALQFVRKFWLIALSLSYFRGGPCNKYHRHDVSPHIKKPNNNNNSNNYGNQINIFSLQGRPVLCFLAFLE